MQPNIVDHDLRYLKIWILLNQGVLSLKYQSLTPSSGSQDIEVGKFMFVAKFDSIPLETNLYKSQPI